MPRTDAQRNERKKGVEPKDLTEEELEQFIIK